MRTVVIGTAGHIDHGKTTLLRALTGIDADRLPEERRRGMTIDVGFAHLDLGDGTALDFVDVPGHDRLVGNMLVGAGEIDGVLLVIAADDGPRAQTLEHLELLDALGLVRAVVAVTKADAVDTHRVAEVVAAARDLVGRTSFGGSPIVAVSATSGSGLPELRSELVALRDRLLADAVAFPGPVRLAIDRAFSVKGRGSVVTGTLRGGSVVAGDVLRLEPRGASVRVRALQVHHGLADRSDGGRAALNLAGADAEALRRGAVVTGGPGVVTTDRLLVALRPPATLRAGGRESAWPPRPTAAVSLHLWTEAVTASVRPAGPRWTEVPGGAGVAVLHLARQIAAMTGARAVLRDPGSGRTVGGVTLLDTAPPRGVSRRRMTAERMARLATAGSADDAIAAMLDLHGTLSSDRVVAVSAALASGPATPPPPGSSSLALAPDVAAAMADAAREVATSAPSMAQLRATLITRLRRLVSVDRAMAAPAADAVDRVITELVEGGELEGDGDAIRPARPGRARDSAANARAAALDRLEALLDVDVPPSLAEAAGLAGCPPDGIVALERGGRIVRVEDDLAWSAARYEALRERALELARLRPLPPAAFRDAIGGNRRVALALLEDFGRKGFLRRTSAGHVPGPRAPISA
jgi:selenocysteine-specific elongation factor